MKIRDFIERRFKERLTQFPCLAIYDPEQRYREIVRSLADGHVTVVEADKSTTLGRERLAIFENRLKCPAGAQFAFF